MKGIVLAGGTATRLFPLTIVTNKHLLPIYDRPMIYYPIETLAGMGIREVMVIVGGKSVGDVVELLGDGSALRARPDLPLPARARSGSPTPSAWPATSSATTRSAASSATTSCAARRWPTSPREFEAGPWGAGTLLYRVPDPERFGVAELDADGRVVGFEEKPERAQERPHPDRRLLPAAGRLRRHRRASRRPAAASSRSPTCSTTTSRTAASSRRVYDGHWTDAGTVPSLLRAAELAAEDDAAGRLAPPASRPLG